MTSWNLAPRPAAAGEPSDGEDDLSEERFGRADRNAPPHDDDPWTRGPDRDAQDGSVRIAAPSAKSSYFLQDRIINFSFY